MRIEHTAFNVAEPQKMAAWYAEHPGFTIERAVHEPPYMPFLADETGGVMIEICHNTARERRGPAQDHPGRGHTLHAPRPLGLPGAALRARPAHGAVVQACMRRLSDGYAMTPLLSARR